MKDNINKTRENEGESQNVIPGTKPFTKFKFIELGVCILAVVIGVLYLYAKVIPLSVLFPLFVLCFAAIPVLRFLDIKERGGKGFAEYLPAVAWAVMAAITVVAMIAYYVKLF